MENDQPILDTLTERDREVLSLIVEGLNNREIAECLGLHYQTVRNRVSQIYKKLALPPKRMGLLLWAYNHGYQDPATIAPWLKLKMQILHSQGGDH